MSRRGAVRRPSDTPRGRRSANRGRGRRVTAVRSGPGLYLGSRESAHRFQRDARTTGCSLLVSEGRKDNHPLAHRFSFQSRF